MKKSVVFSFSLIGQIGFSVAIPLILFALTGRFFDKKLDTSPYFFLAGIVLATVVIYFTVKAIVIRALKELNGN